MTNPARSFILGALVLLALAVSATHAGTILFVGANSTPTTGADGAAYAYLGGIFGHGQVDYLQATSATTASADGYKLLVISSTPSSGDTRGKWQNSTVPILNWEEAIVNDDANEFFMSDSVLNTSANPQRIQITNPAHPIAAGIAGPVVEVKSSGTDNFAYGVTLGPGVGSIGHQEGDPNNFAILYAEPGAALRGGVISPNRRVMFPMGDNAFNQLTAEGKQLFGQAAQWAAGPTVASPLVTYTFPTNTGGETGPAYLPTSISPQLQTTPGSAVRDAAGTITMEISSPGAYNSLPVLRVLPPNGATDLALAQAANSYFEFTVTPQPGISLDLAELDFQAAMGGTTTPRGFGLFSDRDNYATALVTADIPTIRPNWTQYFADLSGPLFQDLTGPVTFRMVIYAPSSGSSIEFDNLTLFGVANVPEPGTLALLSCALASLALFVGAKQRRRRARLAPQTVARRSER